MNYNELNERLNQLRTEDFIWIIYIGIIFMSWIANSLERNYFLNNNLESKEKYRRLMILIFVIAILIYIYFLKDSADDLRKLKPSDTKEKKQLTFLSFVGSVLIAVSGFIFLYIAIKDEDIDVELAFN